jgi:hypothetical protein
MDRFAADNRHQGRLRHRTGLTVGCTYDISADGRQFLMLKPLSDRSVTPPQIIVVQYFTRN